MKRVRVFLLVTLAVALCASAPAQNDLDQIKVKCVKGHDGCTLTHENDGQGGGIQDLGGAGTTGNDIDQLGGGNPPTTGDGDPPTNTGDGNPVLTPPDNGDGTETDLQRDERLARAERERIERANRRIEAAKGNGNNEELRRATQELMRAQNKMRTEMDRRMDGVRRAATGSSAKLSQAIAGLKAWQTEMVKAGLTKEVATWYVTNKSAIEQLVTAYGSEDEPGPLRWLSTNYESIKELTDEKGNILGTAKDWEQIADRYSDKADSDGNSYGKFPLTYMAIQTDNNTTEIKKLWGSIGSEGWVKVLSIASFVGVIVLVLLKIFKK